MIVSNLGPRPDIKSKYPYLGIWAKDIEKMYIVLFVAEGTGTVVWSNNETVPVGENTETAGLDWNEKQFEYFTGSINLKND